MDEKTVAEFSNLYSENHDRVYKLALSLSGSRYDADDITQAAFLRAFRSFECFRGDSAFATWIFRITLNVAKDYIRQRSKMPLQTLSEDMGYSLSEVIDDNPENSPEYQLLAKEARVKCLHCITECLPDEQRKMFCLAVTLGLPYKTVAAIMDCSLSKAKTTVHRARQRWFGYMENRCSFINKANPCNCLQWVRFGLKQGWIRKDQAAAVVGSTKLEVNMQALAEIRSLKALRDVYGSVYGDAGNKLLLARIKSGIEKQEWSVLSP